MVDYLPRSDTLDATFAALADPTRRRILAALQEGSRGVTQLAAHSGMSLPGFMKHLRTLEDARLLRREKTGRVVTCTLTAEPLKPALDWLSKYERFWNARLDALARFLYRQDETRAWPKSRRNPRSRSSAGLRRRRKRSGGRGPTPRR